MCLTVYGTEWGIFCADVSFSNYSLTHLLLLGLKEYTLISRQYPGSRITSVILIITIL